MTKMIAVPLAAALLLAACADDRYYADAYYNYGPAPGMWGEQAIVPPAGLLTSRQGEMVGRMISTPRQANLMTIDAVLIDPSDRVPDYVVARTRSGYITIPVSTLVPYENGYFVHASDNWLGSLRHLSVAELEASYRVTTLEPAAPAFAAARDDDDYGYPGEALRLMRSGNPVGYSVVDARGGIVGTVNSISTAPDGRIRFYIVGGSSLGDGNFIAIPADAARSEGNRIVVDGSAPGWLGMPHYRADQLGQVFGGDAS